MKIILKQFRKEYVQENLNLQLKGITLAIYASMVLVLLFNILDFLVIPGQQMFFLKLRLLSVVFLGAGVLLIKAREDFVKRYMFVFTFVATMIVSIPIIIMIIFYKGHESSYYVGLIMIITGTSLLIPWSLVQGGIVYGTIYAGYLGSIFSFDHITNWPLFSNNNFFMLSFIIFSLFSLYTRQIYRKNNFLSRIELRKANDTIKIAYEELKHFDELKTNFFFNISHDIRNPLTLIMGPLQTLLEGPFAHANDKVKQHLKIMLKNAEILHQLLSNLLDFSKLEAGKTNLELGVMDLNIHIRNIVTSFTSMANSKGIAIFFKSESKIPTLRYDSNKIERVIYNLLSNAIKVTPKGGTVFVGLKKVDNDLRIWIKDTGIGIRPEDQKKIFDRFCQVDEGNKGLYGGTGIGLALVKEFIELHGGKVWVESEQGKGSVFTVSLPYNSLKTAGTMKDVSDTEEIDFPHEPKSTIKPTLEKSTDPIMLKEETFQSNQKEKQASQRQKILVIEDSSDMADYITIILSPYFEVITSANGEEGYKIACDKQPDLILSDWMMPLKTGIEVCKEVKSNKELAHIPFILLTGRAVIDAKVDALESGADDYLIKPFNRKELLARIANLLKNRELEAKLHKENIFLSYYDTLTKLPNRRLFNDRLVQSLAHASRNKQQVAILFLNLDRFKIINETAGYTTGDLLLSAISKRLKKCIRKEDTLARQGGDEFLAMLIGIPKVEVAAIIAQKILKNISEMHHPSDGYEIPLNASIGISIYPYDSENPEILIKNADIAMSRAKEDGGNTYQFYTKDMHDRIKKRFDLETDLRHALRQGEFEVYYQPKVDLRHGHITGTEALVRWKRPNGGMVLPSEFIPLAEDVGFVSEINEWVLHTACKQNKAWQTAGLRPIKVSVNLSSQQFVKQNLVELSNRVLQETGMDVKFLEFEVTESNAMKNVNTASDILRNLKQMGASISIDDFGTGYSSLSYLKTLPVHTVKIDRSFIHDMTRGPDSKAIVTAITAMAHSLGLSVIAEGVETDEQLTFLRSIECDEMQGYFFSRPLPAAELGNLLAEGRCL